MPKKKIDSRPRRERAGMTYEPVDDPVLPEVVKTAQMVSIEEQFGGRDIRLVIRDLYNECGSKSEVAKRLGLEQSTITYWGWRLNIVFTQQPIAVINTL